MIMVAGEKASSDQEMLSLINEELKRWKISSSRALECIDEYLEHLNQTIKERESLPRGIASDPIYLRHKHERSILLGAKKLLSKK
jgi:hypothetical protein